jgi:hypothetical protein
MPFLCPQCSTPRRSLEIKAKIELPPDSRSDEITLQVVECSGCSFSGIAVYEESRRGAPDSESATHVGYRLRARDLRELKRMIRQCPEPRDPRCACPVHQTLGARGASGRWSGLNAFELEGEFELQL